MFVRCNTCLLAVARNPAGAGEWLVVFFAQYAPHGQKRKLGGIPQPWGSGPKHLRREGDSPVPGPMRSQCPPVTPRDDTMSVLHMFLPVCEPARSEALAQLRKTHHLPRHLVKGIAIRHHAESEPAAAPDAQQAQLQAQIPPQEAQAQASPQ